MACPKHMAILDDSRYDGNRKSLKRMKGGTNHEN